ncbi:MAG: hypothetical protein RL391_1357 [Actinomycetota bacterium]
MIDDHRVADRISEIRDRIDRRGRSGVRLVAVTKGFGVEAMTAAVRAGCSDVGENYAQELIAKMSQFPDGVERPTVHFIGRLQSNKVRAVSPLVGWWHTIDRRELVTEVARRSPGARVLVQVNATGEIDKGGCRPHDVEGLVADAAAAGLDPVGLMTVGPTDGDVTETRRVFRACALLAHDLGLHELSMGMTNDLDIALDAGSTIVRVGSAIFGDRPPAT